MNNNKENHNNVKYFSLMADHIALCKQIILNGCLRESKRKAAFLQYLDYEQLLHIQINIAVNSVKSQ